MESRRTYFDAMEKTNPTEEDKKKVVEFQNYIALFKRYQEYAPFLAQEITDDYHQKIEYFKNSHESKYDNLLKQDQELQKIVSMAQLREEKREKDLVYSRKLVQKKEARAGFTNASILIFVVFNLGLFLASLLLIFQ